MGGARKYSGRGVKQRVVREVWGYSETKECSTAGPPLVFIQSDHLFRGVAWGVVLGSKDGMIEVVNARGTQRARRRN